MINPEKARTVAHEVLNKYLESPVLEFFVSSCELERAGGTPVFEVKGSVVCLVKKRKLLPGRKTKEWEFEIKVHAESGEPLSWRIKIESASSRRRRGKARKRDRGEELFNLAMQEENEDRKLQLLKEILEKFPRTEWADKALEEVMRMRER